MKKRRFLTAGLSALLALSNVIPVLAADVQTFENTSDSADVLVDCEIPSGYIVTLPATIILEQTNQYSGYNFGTEYKIGVQGNIDADKVVTVRAKDDVFEMSDSSGKRTIYFDIVQDEKEWPSDELGDGTENIEKDAGAFADVEYAGNYNGTAQYEFFLGTGQPVVKRAAGAYDADGNMTMTWDELTAIGFNSDKMNTNILPIVQNAVKDKDIVISDSVTEIRRDAFRDMSPRSITIPNSVTKIGEYAFAGCTATTIKIPNSVTTIDEYAFCGSGLTSVVIPNSVTTLENHAFYACKDLKSIIISNSLTELNDSVFASCFALESIVIPNSIATIKHQAFYGCTSLTSIKIPRSVTTLEDYAFSGCHSATSIEMPNTITSIGKKAFSNCVVLESVEIPDSITEISEGMFNHCNELKEVTIPNTITKINNEAFENCGKLTSVDIPDSVTYIGDKTFANTGIKSLVVPSTVTQIGKNAFDWIPVVYYNGSAKGSPWGARAIKR